MNTRQLWIEWIRNIPNWAKAAITVVGVIVGFILAFRENYYLYTTVSVFLLLVGAFGFSLFITFAKTAPMIEGGLGVYRFERYRKWAMFGIVAFPILGILLVALTPSRKFIIVALNGTPTPTLAPTSTATPTSTPKPTPITLPEPDVLIAEFDARHATRTLEVARRLEADLQSRLRDFDLPNINIQVLSKVVTSEAEVQSLFNESGSKVIIWGWYDDAGIQVRIFLSGGNLPSREVQGIREVPLELGGASTAQLSLAIRDVLPENVSFLSLYVIGHLYYQANEYQAGHKAFDAATASLPETVALENEAVLHFFLARQMESSSSDDMTTIVCEYAKAIKLNSSFAEAFNNLGVVLAYHFYSDLPEEAKVCLSDIGLKNTSPIPLFDRALSLRPNWAITEYNKLGFYWVNPDPVIESSEDRVVKELKPSLESIIQRDPSILGAYAILGNIALFEEKDPDTAAQWYEVGLSTASDTGSLSAQMHFNLGQIYLLTGEAFKAEAEFNTALSHVLNEPEASLARANLAYQQGRKDTALLFLRDIPITEEKSTFPSTAKSAGLVIESRIHFDNNQPELAIKALEDVISGVKLQGKTLKTPFEHFVLALLYKWSGDEEKAAEHEQKIIDDGSWDSLDWDSNATSALAWYAFIEDCGSVFKERVYTLGVLQANDTCPPADLREKIDTAYDYFQIQLPFRLYFRRSSLLVDIGDILIGTSP